MRHIRRRQLGILGRRKVDELSQLAVLVVLLVALLLLELLPLLDEIALLLEGLHAGVPTLSAGELEEHLLVTFDHDDEARVADPVRAVLRNADDIADREDHLRNAGGSVGGSTGFRGYG